VYVDKAANASASGSVTLQATSESDPSKSTSVSCSVGTGDTVSGTVPATLALNLGTAANFGPFTPGAQKDYYATTAAKVTSTAGDATLSVSDAGANPGHLVNGAFALPEALQVNGTLGTTAGNTYAPLGAAAASLVSWANPVSNDDVTIGFKQPIKANDALRTGSYAKTLTFTLSTTNP